MQFDVTVVGGGPAGSACAWFLGQAGLRVLLVEAAAVPRDKVCGDGWGHRKAVPILQAMGLLERLPAHSWRPISGMLIGAPSGATLRLTLPRDGHAFSPFGLTCRRQILDEALWRQAAQVAEVRDQLAVTSLSPQGTSAVVLTARDGRTERMEQFVSQFVVGADGARSVVARQLDLTPPAGRYAGVGWRAYYHGVVGLANCVELYFLRSLAPGYLWVFPLSAHEANVGVISLAPRLPRGGPLEDRLTRCLREHPTLRERFQHSERIGPVQGGLLPARPNLRAVGRGRVLLAGDAAGLIDPWLWEGLGNALWSGRLAAEVLTAAGRTGGSHRVAADYQRRLREELGGELARGAWLQRMASWSGVWDLLVQSARRVPALAGLLSRSFVAPQAHQLAVGAGNRFVERRTRRDHEEAMR